MASPPQPVPLPVAPVPLLRKSPTESAPGVSSDRVTGALAKGKGSVPEPSSVAVKTPGSTSAMVTQTPGNYPPSVPAQPVGEGNSNSEDISVEAPMEKSDQKNISGTLMVNRSTSTGVTKEAVCENSYAAIKGEGANTPAPAVVNSLLQANSATLVQGATAQSKSSEGNNTVPDSANSTKILAASANTNACGDEGIVATCSRLMKQTEETTNMNVAAAIAEASLAKPQSLPIQGLHSAPQGKGVVDSPVPTKDSDSLLASLSSFSQGRSSALAVSTSVQTSCFGGNSPQPVFPGSSVLSTPAASAAFVGLSPVLSSGIRKADPVSAQVLSTLKNTGFSVTQEPWPGTTDFATSCDADAAGAQVATDQLLTLPLSNVQPHEIKRAQDEGFGLSTEADGFGFPSAISGSSAAAAAAVLAQQESRPLLLTRFEMLEAYAKGRLCLSCDSKSHRMPSCPFGEFVCPNCHRSSHRGEECPLRCRFCQQLHVGVSVTVCIKRFRGPLEALLGISLPLRDLQPTSLLSTGSPSSPLGQPASARPNSAFGRSVYVSNLPPNTTQEMLAAAVDALLTKGRIMQIHGVTLKVQFKKTGVFNNAMPQNSATIACVLAGAGTPLNATFSPGTSRAHNASSVMTPLSAASSPTGAYGPGASPTFSPSISSLLIFLGPPSPPTVSEICAQVAAKLKEDLQLGLVTAQQHSPSASAVSARGSFPQRSESAQLQQLQDLQKHLQSQDFPGVISVPFEVPTPHSTSAAALFAAAAASQVSPPDTAVVTPSLLEKADIPDISVKSTNRPTPIASSAGTKNFPSRSTTSPAFPAALHYANYANSIFGNNTSTAQALSQLVTGAHRGESGSYPGASLDKEVAAGGAAARTGSGHPFSQLTSDKLLLLQLLQQQQEQQGKKQVQDLCAAQKPQQPALLTETLMRAASGSAKASQAVTRAALARQQVERQLQQQEERKQADQLLLQMHRKDAQLEAHCISSLVCHQRSSTFTSSAMAGTESLFQHSASLPPRSPAFKAVGSLVDDTGNLLPMVRSNTDNAGRLNSSTKLSALSKLFERGSSLQHPWALAASSHSEQAERPTFLDIRQQVHPQSIPGNTLSTESGGGSQGLVQAVSCPRMPGVNGHSTKKNAGDSIFSAPELNTIVMNCATSSLSSAPKNSGGFPGPKTQEVEQLNSAMGSGVSCSAVAAASAAAAAASAVGGEASQQLLDVAASLMHKAVEENSDVEDVAQQLYQATRELPQEVVHQLLVALATRGTQGSSAGSDTQSQTRTEDHNGALASNASFLVH
ncbi:proteophosphoglycan related protein [Cystoisospora suis]|uniref:Proteophosphoglycan related protein n=1 Tax=Cystoisospora suis TaxID=483139 RepID=A0A2C6LDB4_9APIC|nr:proteophosphoglycan related protein [Cystoisospora suis]